MPVKEKVILIGDIHKTPLYEDAKEWAKKVQAQMKRNAARFDKGKKRPRTYTKRNRNGKEIEVKEQRLRYSIKTKTSTKYTPIGIHFPLALHGVYRAYGVGRGQPRTAGKARALKVRVRRTQADWFDEPITANIAELSYKASEYYGDQVLVNAYKLLIKKT